MQADSTTAISPRSWRPVVAKYETPDVRRSAWQIANSFIPFFVLWYLAYRALEVSYLLTLAVAVLAGGFLMRIFIILHDCGHGSLFRSQNANHFWGVLAGFFTLTPYFRWRHEHAIHHATAGDLDRRGVGDVWTLTVKEYLALPRRQQLWYRFFRNPVVILVLGPLFTFVWSHRFVGKGAARERNSVYYTNAVVVAIIAGLSLLIGVRSFLLVHVPIMWIGGAAGVWLFYVQHQFENTYWARHADWDYVRSAMQGASCYELPKVLQFFSGSIGFHHIHHLGPRIPNYNLERCQRNEPYFKDIVPLTLRTSLKCAGLSLWDEERQRLVGFGSIGR